MNIYKKVFIRTSALIAIIACLADIGLTTYYSSQYPGYNNFRDTMSKLGATNSPVGFQMSVWWVMLGGLFFYFALGFRALYKNQNKFIKISFWLIVVYAIGEGLGSGIFPADHLKNGLGFSLIIHDLMGGIGIAGIMVFPYAIKRTKITQMHKNVKLISNVVLIVGPIFLIMFSLSKTLNLSNNFIVEYKGLWQRLLMLNYYFYLIIVAIFMQHDLKMDRNTYLNNIQIPV